jgi:hypothetical protein
MKQFIRLILPLRLVAIIPAVAPSQQQARQPKDLFDDALKLYEDGKFDQALPLALKVTELVPNEFAPRALTGYIYVAQGKYNLRHRQYLPAVYRHAHTRRKPEAR